MAVAVASTPADRLAHAVVTHVFRLPYPPEDRIDLASFPGGILTPDERASRLRTIRREFLRAHAEDLCRHYPPEVIAAVYVLIDQRLEG